MKRFHVHAHVDDLKASVAFYSKLFAAEPTRLESDYAKWMIEDPRINFAISTRGGKPGVDHLGFQTDSDEELAELKARAQAADMALLDEGETTCCYARSEKHWVTDPQGIAWEHFHTLDNIPMFSQTSGRRAAEASRLLRQRLRRAASRSAFRSSRLRPAAEAVSMADRDLQRAVHLHGQLGALDHRRRADERRSASGRFKAYSAGSHPTGAVNPFALRSARRAAHSDRRLSQQELGRVRRPGAPPLDFVFTVCDRPPARPARSGPASR